MKISDVRLKKDPKEATLTAFDEQKTPIPPKTPAPPKKQQETGYLFKPFKPFV